VIKKKAPAYFLGEKSNKDCLELHVGTNDLIGPGAYKPEESKKPSKHTDSPKWTIGKSKRKGLNLKVWTKNETYAVVSSVGDQAVSRKKTEPKIKMGKSTRDTDKKLGMFPSMMSKQPTRIRIEHPKL
jgi:Sperm-tail PG-rich repeat